MECLGSELKDLESQAWQRNAQHGGNTCDLVRIRRVSVEREIINVYDVFEPVGPLTHIFFAPGRRPVPRWGAYSAPQTAPHSKCHSHF